MGKLCEVRLSGPCLSPRSLVDVHTSNLPVRVFQSFGLTLYVLVARFVQFRFILTVHKVAIASDGSTECCVQN